MSKYICMYVCMYIHTQVSWGVICDKKKKKKTNTSHHQILVLSRRLYLFIFLGRRVFRAPKLEEGTYSVCECARARVYAEHGVMRTVRMVRM